MGFSHKYSYGLRENPEIIFTSDRTGSQRAITDKKGRFVGFPGIVKEKEWTSHLTEEGCLDPVIRYRTDFVKFDDHSYMILWEVQPDGRYWADEDGFGMTSDEEICLYALLDLDGNYIGPFRVYKVGVRRYVERPQKPVLVSECGGYSWTVPGHSYAKYTNYGYGGCKDSQSLTGRIEALYRETILTAIPKGLAGCVYTQLSDVEDETNGCYTYDRRVCKVDRAAMRRLAKELEEKLAGREKP